MTKLTEFLIPVLAIGSVWLLFLYGFIPYVSETAWWYYVLPFPLYCGIGLGLYALVSIAYGVYSVKDDSGALDLLKKDIQRAFEGLKEKGFHFDN